MCAKPNKLSAKDQRQIENRRSRLRSQGVGEDDATKQAIDEVTSEGLSGQGGGKSSGGNPQKGAGTGSRRRTGSRSDTAN